MQENREPVHPWVIVTVMREALQRVFNPSLVQLEQLVNNSPFLDLVVEEQLCLQNPERCRERHIDARRRAIQAIRGQQLYHNCESSICAVNAFLAYVRQQLRPHGTTTSVAMTS